MITVAVAARTMDRQARYRSLLPEEKYSLVLALDCPTLARWVKSRPIQIIVFDLQKPAMPAVEWLNTAEQDPDLQNIPVIWVGRDAPAEAFERIRKLRNGLILPPRPNAEALDEAVGKIAYAVAAGSAGGGDWRPDGDIIEAALDIFGCSPEEKQAPETGDDADDAAPDWQVSELPSGAPGQRQNGTPDKVSIDADPEPGATQRGPVEENTVRLSVEEISTGNYGLIAGKHKTGPGMVNEKIMSITTDPGLKNAKRRHDLLVERITNSLFEKLADRLADEVRSMLDPTILSRLVERELGGQKDQLPPSSPPPPPPA